MHPQDAYYKMKHIIEEVNALLCLYAGDNNEEFPLLSPR
jgi:hypothetical protein